LWSNGQAGLTAVGLQAGIFSAVATDDNGCTASVSITVSSTDLIPPVLSAVDAEVAIGPEGNVFLTQQNLNVQITDNCGFGSFTTSPNEFNCAQLGDHQVVITATDNSGNISRDTITVTIVDNSAPSLICPPSLALCYENRQVMYQAPTASDNCLSLGGSFNLVAGLPIGSVFPVGSTTNTYSYTDANGNTGNCSFEITIFPEIVVSVDTVINDFNFQTIGAVLIDVSGGLPPLTYSWLLNGQQVSTAQDLSGSPAGNYTLVITDDNDCSVTRTFTISNTSATENPVLADGIRIFPNPANNWITVALPEELSGQETDVQVFDMTGRRVLSQYSEGDSQIRLSLSGFAEGLYHVMISSGSVRTSRIVVLVK
ncbi:MAG: T9SS type A sorting domain-containing protein, partial [Bacteroidota bacterium]